MFKKWGTRLLRIGLGILLMGVILDAGLHGISRTEWFKNRVTGAIESALGRDIQLTRMGMDLRGIFIEDVSIAEQGGFENGTFIKAGQLRIRVSLLHLLHGHVKVNLILLSDVAIRATTFEERKNSWQDLVTADQEEQLSQEDTPAKVPFRITATHLRLENVHLIYEDKTVPHILDIEGLTVGVDHFSLHEPFSFYVQAELHPTIQGKSFNFPFILRAKANLKGLDLSQAYVDVHALSLAYHKASVLVKGRVENLANPHADMKVVLRHFSSQDLADIVPLPSFDLNKAEVSTKLVVDLEKSAFTLHTLTVKAPGTTFQAKGGLLYGEPKSLEYDFSAEGNLNLGEVGRWVSFLAEPYRLMGEVQTQVHATHQQLSGELNLAGVGGFVPQAGYISDVDAQFHFRETMDFKTGAADVKLAGKLNGRPLETALRADQQMDVLDIVASLQAEEIVISPSSNTQTDAASEEIPPTNENTSTNWPLPPVRVKAEISVGKLDVPYFYGTDISFKADMKGLTPDLKQAHGSLQLSTGNGKIQDLYKLTNANPLTKVLFLSLDIVGKVFNSLNVLGVLNSIGGGIVSAVTGEDKDPAAASVHTQTVLGPDGEPIEVPVKETDKNVEGELAYDKFDTSVNFEQGVATVKKGNFVSSMMSFRIDGKTDFNTQQVDLTVHAAPGRHEVDGMLPLTLTINGTVDNPQGSMSMLGSVTSLVTQSVTNNVVSRQVGKGVRGIVNLFKKKEPDEVAEETEPSQPVISSESTETY